ncbi:MAG TPA: hypothetical protein VJV79_28220 [Polyangiaceae bacterium]|nr:hypothetical protein [Polyangiaceae bacterium]
MVVPLAEEKLGPIRAFVATVGASFIYLLIRIFGRTVQPSAVPWLEGPIGSEYIGDRPYEECAQKEGLDVERRANKGGLIANFDSLASAEFDVARVHPRVRHFYEHTARYRMDVWTETAFPASIGLWLLVTTISRKVNQLNFPLRVLEAAKGMDSEIVLLRDKQGNVRYAGWYRRLVETGRAIYTGFYMVSRTPIADRPAVKVVFPMPHGNATVILRPRLSESGEFELSSEGQSFGDVGFYRIDSKPDGSLRVWRIRTLKEHFRVYVDAANTLRCDHRVRFLGLSVLNLHYRIEQIAA